MISHRPLTSIPLPSPLSLSLSLPRTLAHRPLPCLRSHPHPHPHLHPHPLPRFFHTSRPSLLHDPIRMPNDGTTKRGRRLLEIAHIQQRAITAAEQSLSTSLTPQEIARINETGVEKVHRILREAQIPPQYWKTPPSVMDDATSSTDTSSTSTSTSTSSTSTPTTSRLRTTLAQQVADMNSTTSTHDPYLDEEAEFSVDEDADVDMGEQEQVKDDSDKKISTAIIRVKKIDQWGRAYGSGGRKTATSRVWIKPGTGEFTVNYRPHTEYFHNTRHRFAMFYPFMISNTVGQFDVFATVKGGGLNGQAEAVRHGIARALQNYDPAHRPALKKAHLLTRDNRQVERKKPGRYKARKGYTFVKR